MTHRRERLPVPPASVIRALPAIGKLMITAKRAGATHERIGTVEAVGVEDGWLVCSGAEHDSRIDPGAIHTVIVDRTSIMGDQAYPRIDFRTEADEVLFSVVGFGGLEPFDAALAAFGAGEELPEEPRGPMGSRDEIATDDAGKVPFEEALAAGSTVTVQFSRPGFEQRWSGVVERVNPAMGFINVTRPDFHLHLRGGTVSGWRRTGDSAAALDAEGQPTGLVVHGLAAEQKLSA